MWSSFITRIPSVTGLVRRALHTSAPLQGARIYDSVTSTIGDTPIVKINRMAPEGVSVYAKCEFFNPLSSVKDRLAIAVIEDAERKGLLKPGDTVVEATSANTGIALAMVCAAKGYPCVITMAEPFSVERRKVMRMLGAKVIITPAAEKGTGMVKKAQELAKKHGWFQSRQFENQANADYHACTTGPEILRAFASEGIPIDYFVTGYGTGGTLQGVGRVFKAASPATKIVVSEPVGAALLSSGQPQAREPDGSSAATHPAWTPHPIQGWTPDFVSMLLEDAKAYYDLVRQVEHSDAIRTSQELARLEGIFTGISGGASMATALQVAREAPKGSVVVTMLPDTAERYLSTPLFKNIDADMNEAELELSRSTPGFQL